MTAGTSAPASGAFGQALAQIRRQRRLSQSRLANAAGIDHSTVSRLEGGQRVPSRAMVLVLADALEATDAERDALLEAAGYCGVAPATEHTVAVALCDLLDDPLISEVVKDDIRHITALLIRQARRAVAA